MASYQRTPEQIRADIAASRHAVTVGLEGLVSEVHPSAIKETVKQAASDVVEDAKASAFDSVRSVKEWFVDEGGVRWNNVGTVALAVVGVVAVAGSLSGVASLVRRGFGR